MQDRELNDVFTEEVPWAYEHAAISATIQIKLRTTQSPLRFARAEYDNPTGFATVSGTDFWTVNVLAGATVVASWNTSATVAGVSGAIPADTFFDLPLSATDANRVASGTPSAPITISVQFVKTGAPANLPAGRFFFHARLI